MVQLDKTHDALSISCDVQAFIWLHSDLIYST